MRARGLTRRDALTLLGGTLTGACAHAPVGVSAQEHSAPSSPGFRPLTPWSLDDLARAPFRIVSEGVLPAPADEVFDVLGAPEPWPEWFPTIERIEYRTPAPHGVGTERDAVTGVGTIREHFVAWEPGARIAFFVREASMPALTAFMEHYELRPLGEQRCHLTWTVGYDLELWARLAHPLVAGAVRDTFARGVVDLAAWLEARHPA